MQWRTPITLAVLLVILLGAAFYGWRTVVDPSTSGTAQTPATPRPPVTTRVCTERKTYPKGSQVRAASFKVNVYNAGGVSGQAGDVLAALQSRGFRQGVADNPPAGVTASNVTILTWAPNQPQVRLAQEQFRGPVRLARGPNLAPGVDIVVGSGFQGLATGAPTSITITKPTTVCVAFTTKRVQPR
ncbi:MAG: LytR C-terminal domain-containing protein [Nocardioidaceae bacterium]